MSSYETIAKRSPEDEFEKVSMIDDYYGNHQYGVVFKDGYTCPEKDVIFQEPDQDE